MKRINNKGYMLIEIVLAAVITFTIAFSLLNMIIKFKNKNEDIYNDTKLINDKVNITKNIMNDMEGYKVVETNVTTTGSGSKQIQNVDITLTKENGSETTKKRIIIDKKNSTVTYGNVVNEEITVGNVSYYKKVLQASTEVGTVSISDEGSTKIITMPISSIYSKKKHYINIILNVYNSYTINYNDNLFTVDTVEGLIQSFDTNTQILTINGTLDNNTTSIPLGKLSGLTIGTNDSYKVNLTHISGDRTENEQTSFIIEFLQSNGERYETRTAGQTHALVELPNPSKKKTEITLSSTDVTSPKGLEFWIFKDSEEEEVTFNNYQIKVEITKVRNSFSVKYNEKYSNNSLEIPSKGDGYTFKGWFINPEDTEPIDNNKIVTLAKDHTLYARWEK